MTVDPRGDDKDPLTPFVDQQLIRSFYENPAEQPTAEYGWPGAPGWAAAGPGAPAPSGGGRRRRTVVAGVIAGLVVIAAIVVVAVLVSR
jgi:hypothetical protein